MLIIIIICSDEQLGKCHIPWLSLENGGREVLGRAEFACGCESHSVQVLDTAWEFRRRSEHSKGKLAAQRRTRKYVCKAKRFLTGRVKKEWGGQWPEGSAWAEMEEMKLQWWARSQWKPRGEGRSITTSLMLVLHLLFITSMTLVSNARCSWPVCYFFFNEECYLTICLTNSCGSKNEYKNSLKSRKKNTNDKKFIFHYKVGDNNQLKAILH